MVAAEIVATRNGPDHGFSASLQMALKSQVVVCATERGHSKFKTPDQSSIVGRGL